MRVLPAGEDLGGALIFLLILHHAKNFDKRAANASLANTQANAVCRQG